MQDTVVVLELLLCASALLGFIFGPKIYIILSYEPVIVEVRPQNVLREFVFDNDLFEKGEVLSDYCNNQQITANKIMYTFENERLNHKFLLTKIYDLIFGYIYYY